MKEIVIDENGAGKRLDKFLFRYLPGAPKSLLYAQLRRKNVTLNGKKATGSELLAAGDVLQCWFSDETWENFLHPALKAGTGSGAPGQGDTEELLRIAAGCYERHPEVDVIYEDEELLVLDKPAGLLTQRAGRDDESLNDWLLGYLIAEKDFDPRSLAVFRPSVCHRLDRNTSGIVLCAKSLRAAQKTAEQLRDRSLHKYYLAAVHGRVREGADVTSRLIKNERTNTVQILPDGQNAAGSSMIRTAYAPACYDAQDDVTILVAGLITGKAHQLRAQFAAIGHPIVGDRKYGGDRTCDDRKRFHAAHQLLHAVYVIDEDRTFYAAPSGRAWERFVRDISREKIEELTEMQILRGKT